MIAMMITATEQPIMIKRLRLVLRAELVGWDAADDCGAVVDWEPEVVVDDGADWVSVFGLLSVFIIYLLVFVVLLNNYNTE